MAAFDPWAPAVTGAIQQVAAAVWRIVAPNPSPLTGPGTNTYVVGTERPVVIDPGCDDATHLERVLEVAGGAVASIVCTHSHPDHSPCARWLKERSHTRRVSLRPHHFGTVLKRFVELLYDGARELPLIARTTMDRLAPSSESTWATAATV